MKTFLLLLGLVAFFELSDNAPIRPARSSLYAEDTDLLVDAALQMVRGFLRKNDLDPMVLPDLNIHTDTKILGIRVNIYLHSTGLTLKGLSTLKKTDYLQVNLLPDNMVNIRAVVTLNNLFVEGKGSLKVGVFSMDVASIHIENLKVLAELQLPKDEGRQPRATKFEIQEIGTITISRGHGGKINEWLDKGASFIVNKFRDTMKTQIAPLILENLNTALQLLTGVLF